MPDSAGLGQRPVVRRVSATHNDLVSRFEQNRRSSQTSLGSGVDSPSMSGTSTPTHPSEKSTKTRTPSVKSKSSKSKTEKELEQKVLNWITSVIHEKPTSDYEDFIHDGSVLARVMTSIVFNSVPKEDINCEWGANPARDRVKALIFEIRRYGVKELFEAEDLIEGRNIDKVTKCLAQLAKLAASDKDNLLHAQ